MSVTLNELPFTVKEGWPWKSFPTENFYKKNLNYPKISIITPSYNQGVYLEETIRSVLLQNYPNLEYIIIDGGSSDNSVEIIKKYAPWITYWVSEKDNGQSEAINKGLKLATGEIINWLNSDDYYEPGTLFKVAEAFAKENTLVVCGRSFLFKENREIVRESKGTDVYSNNLPKTIGWARIDQPETFFRKEALAVMGPLDTRLHYLMDRDWWVKFLLNFGLEHVKLIPDFLVNFRLHNDSKTVSQFDRFQIEHDTYFYALAKKSNFDLIADKIAEVMNVEFGFVIDYDLLKNRQLVYEALNYYLLLRANEFYNLFDKVKSRKLLSSINPTTLSVADERLWRTLKFRNSLPVSLIKLFRKTN